MTTGSESGVMQLSTVFSAVVADMLSVAEHQLTVSTSDESAVAVGAAAAAVVLSSQLSGAE